MYLIFDVLQFFDLLLFNLKKVVLIYISLKKFHTYYIYSFVQKK